MQATDAREMQRRAMADGAGQSAPAEASSGDALAVAQERCAELSRRLSLSEVRRRAVEEQLRLARHEIETLGLQDASKRLQLERASQRVHELSLDLHRSRRPAFAYELSSRPVSAAHAYKAAVSRRMAPNSRLGEELRATLP